MNILIQFPLKKPPVAISIAIIALLGLGAVVVERTLNGTSDLRGFYWNWQDPASLPAETPPGVDPDPYPPSSYILFAPLGRCPLILVASLWYLGQLVLTWRILGLLQLLSGIPLSIGEQTTISNRDVDPKPIPLAFEFLVLLPFWLGTLLLGQNTVLLIWLVTEAWASRQKSPWLAGFLLALATLIKILPALFLTPFILKGRLQVLASFAITTLLVILVGGSLLFGWSRNLEHHSKWLARNLNVEEDPLSPDTMRGSTRYNNQALSAVLARYTMPIPVHGSDPDSKINLVSLSAGSWRTLRNTITAILILISLASIWFLDWEKKPIGPLGILSSLLLIVSPIVWSHYGIWLLCSLASLRENRRSWQIALGLVLIITLSLASKTLRAFGIPCFAHIAIWALCVLRLKTGDFRL